MPTTLALSADGELAEGGEPIVLAAETDRPAPKRIRVDLAFGGTAVRGPTADYWVRIPAILIPAGETRGELELTVVDDEEAEDEETVVIEAASDDPPLSAAPLTLAIKDDDLKPVPALPLGGLMLLGLLLAWRGVISRS